MLVVVGTVSRPVAGTLSSVCHNTYPEYLEESRVHDDLEIIADGNEKYYDALGTGNQSVSHQLLGSMKPRHC